MPNWGQDFLQGFTATQNLRDYRHASKTFTTNYYELKPRFKFLFHVQFTLNTEQIPALRNSRILQSTQIDTISLAVKTVDLPKYKIDTETLNQYNRKRVVQTKINYDPINIVFHDDGGDNVREFWYQYYSYYYKDPAQQYLGTSPRNGPQPNVMNRQNGFGYNDRDIYSQNRTGNVNDWGFIGENFLDGTSTAKGKPPFFKDITIFGFDQHNYARYILVNPIITNWSHDTYDYSQGGGIMQNSMTIAYETVKYYSGKLGAPGTDRWANWPNTSHYDTNKSPIARAGSTVSVGGQGGLIGTAAGIMTDLQKGSTMGLLGAAQKSGALYNTWKNKNLQSVAISEATALGKGVIQQGLPGAVRDVTNKADGWVFPVATGYGNVGRAEYNRYVQQGVTPP